MHVIKSRSAQKCHQHATVGREGHVELFPFVDFGDRKRLASLGLIVNYLQINNVFNCFNSIKLYLRVETLLSVKTT